MESGALSKGPQGRLGAGYPLEDSCRAILTVLEKGKNRQIYNIGGGNERKNVEIAKEILRYPLLPDAIIGFAGDRPGHDFRCSLSCDKIHRLGWKPQVEFEKGLRKTIDWYLAYACCWRLVT